MSGSFRGRVRRPRGPFDTDCGEIGDGNELRGDLLQRGAKIDVAEQGGLTPVDAALGRAGGHGRGSTIEVFEDTAARLRELGAQQPDCDLAKPDGIS